MAGEELNEVYKLAEQHLGVTWFEYQDPVCGRIVRGTAMIDGDNHAWEEPTDKNLKEYAVRYAKQHILEKLMKDKQQKAGE